MIAVGDPTKHGNFLGSPRHFLSPKFCLFETKWEFFQHPQAITPTTFVASGSLAQDRLCTVRAAPSLDWNLAQTLGTLPNCGIGRGRSLSHP
jgi:hypothetical protein